VTPEEERGAPGCSNCKRAGNNVAAAAKKAGRCPWCYDYHREHGVDASVEAVKAREERRIYSPRAAAGAAR
jgi:hypothetical protein